VLALETLCNATGYLPPQQLRPASNEDYPDRPAGDLYCRVSADSPLNDGFAWKGDANATLSGQDIPQRAPETPAAPPIPIAVAQYDPATGTYLAPDGHQSPKPSSHPTRAAHPDSGPTVA
jgi:phospholipid/cholesterol/gamma-HCH transport system substrate-binding protein